MSKIQCLTCGGMADVGDSLSGECPYCGCRVEFRRISSFNAVNSSELGKLTIRFQEAKKKKKESGIQQGKNDNLSLALCYLKTGNISLAKKELTSVIEEFPECAEAYYYYAVTIINGRTLSELTMPEAKQLTEYLKTSMAMDEKFLFPKILYALLCIEYYDENCLRSPDDGEALLQQLSDREVCQEEFAIFKSLVSTETV